MDASVSFNFSYGIAERHYSYLLFPNRLDCFRSMLFFNTTEEACDFISNTDSCHSMVKLFNYLDLIVCKLNFTDSFINSSFLIVGILCAIAGSIYVIAKHFMLPNIVTISHRSGMKNFKFGLTIVAFLVSFPTVVRAMFSCESYEGSILVSGLLGKVCLTIFIGFISLSCKPNYEVKPLGFITYLLTMMGVNVFIQRSVKQSFYTASTFVVESLFTLTIYLFIILFSIVSLHKKHKIKETEDDTEEAILAETASLRSLPSDEYEAENEAEDNIDPWHLFFESMKCFHHFKNRFILIRLLIQPLWVLLALSIPVASERRKLFGWCKFLCCISFVLFPFQLLLYKIEQTVFILLLLICTILSMLTFIFTNVRRVPDNIHVFAAFGLLVASAYFNLLDEEFKVLVNQVMSFYFNWSRDAISTTLEGFGYGFIQSIFCYFLMKTNHEDIAYGVIIGVPLLTLCIVLPSIAFQSCIDATKNLFVSDIAENAYVFTNIVISFTLFSALTTNFVMRYSHAGFLLVLFVLHISMIVLSIEWLIHPYGVKHSTVIIKNVAWA